MKPRTSINNYCESFLHRRSASVRMRIIRRPCGPNEERSGGGSDLRLCVVWRRKHAICFCAAGTPAWSRPIGVPGSRITPQDSDSIQACAPFWLISTRNSHRHARELNVPPMRNERRRCNRTKEAFCSRELKPYSVLCGSHAQTTCCGETWRMQVEGAECRASVHNSCSLQLQH